MNGQLLSKQKKVMDRWKEYFQGKYRDRGKLNRELDMENDFNAKNKETSEPTYVEVRDITLKATLQIAPGTGGITQRFYRNWAQLYEVR